MADPSANSWASSWHPFGGALDPNFYGWGDQALGRPEPSTATIRGQGTLATPAPASARPFATDWYNVPNVRLDPTGSQAWNPTTGGWEAVTVPSWFGSDPQYYQALYALYQQASPADRASMILTQGDLIARRDRGVANQAAGRTWLGDQMTDVRSAGEAWANDPYRNQVMAELARRASPGYSFFTPTQRTAAVLPVGQQYAADSMRMAADAAAHGTSGSGVQTQNNAILRGQAETRGAMVGAQLDSAEQQLHQAALDSLARTGGAYNAADVQYLQASNQLAGALASLETGTEFNPADYTVWPALAEAERNAREEQEWRDRAMTAYENEARYGVNDFGQAVLSGVGSGPVGIGVGTLTGLAELANSASRAA